MCCIIPFKPLIFVSPTSSLYTEPAERLKSLKWKKRPDFKKYKKLNKKKANEEESKHHRKSN